MNGILIYDYARQRYDINFGLDEYYGGLHCGDCLEVYVNGIWKSMRIEYNFDNRKWYLVGYKDIELTGLTVRI